MVDRTQQFFCLLSRQTALASINTISSRSDCHTGRALVLDQLADHHRAKQNILTRRPFHHPETEIKKNFGSLSATEDVKMSNPYEPEVIRIIEVYQSSAKNVSKHLTETSAVISLLSNLVASQAEDIVNIMDNAENSTRLLDRGELYVKNAINGGKINLYLSVWFLFVGCVIFLLDFLW